MPNIEGCVGTGTPIWNYVQGSALFGHLKHTNGDLRSVQIPIQKTIVPRSTQERITVLSSRHKGFLDRSWAYPANE
ncbi:MAG TPA: hypothetical protein PK735_10855, partial [Flavobacteriales bacterium]|nr:hypothetical protein [Flavobacteriales bacterium]